MDGFRGRDENGVAPLQFVVVLTPAEDDPGVYTAHVPGVPGCISTLESPHAALRAVKAALQSLVSSLPGEERRNFLSTYSEIVPGELAPGSRIERVSI